MEIEEVKKEVASILKDELANTAFSAFFFGSRVTRTHTATSDLDVGIEGSGSGPVPENILGSIQARCDALPTLYTIDIVDFSVLGEDFKKVAQEKIERIV